MKNGRKHWHHSIYLFSQNLHHNDQTQKGTERGEEGGREEGRKEGGSVTRMSKEKNKTYRHDCQLEPDKEIVHTLALLYLLFVVSSLPRFCNPKFSFMDEVEKKH
jgi:hypothetical protein